MKRSHDLRNARTEFLLVTQNVDDLHARAGVAAEKMVQIHGDIFVTRCSRCEFRNTGRGGSPAPPGTCVVQPTNGRLRCRVTDAKQRPGFPSPLPQNAISTFQPVQNARRLCVLAWCGSGNNCPRANCYEWKIFSMAELCDVGDRCRNDRHVWLHHRLGAPRQPGWRRTY